MKSVQLYKYINLLIRITIGVGAVGFIYLKIQHNFLEQFASIRLDEINYLLIAIVLVLLFFNWGMEALKWKYVIRKVNKITFLKAFSITITGLTLGLITPNRIGEIPSRALLLDRKEFKQLALKTSVSSFSQLTITVLMGSIGVVITYKQFDLSINYPLLFVGLTILTIVLLLIYFKVNQLERLLNRFSYFRKKKLFEALSDFSFSELLNLLVMSLIRYVVFFIQFWLILKAFNISLLSVHHILLIPVCFLFASVIPTILISEIGVRGSVALFVFGTVSDLGIQIILASILLWMINVALPALFGLLNIHKFSLLKDR